jgi:hypothetical protein
MMTPDIIETMRSELSAALPRWGMSNRARVAFLSHSENTTFLAEDPLAGERLVLRVQRIGYHSSAEIVSELAWIRALIADEVIVTPRPRPDRDGQLLCPVPLNGSMRQVVRRTRPAYQEHEVAKADLKKLVPEDAREAIGHGLRAKRSKSGAISFELLDAEAGHAALQ